MGNFADDGLWSGCFLGCGEMRNKEKLMIYE
jgi:hypothetical protein